MIFQLAIVVLWVIGNSGCITKDVFPDRLSATPSTWACKRQTSTFTPLIVVTLSLEIKQVSCYSSTRNLHDCYIVRLLQLDSFVIAMNKGFPPLFLRVYPSALWQFVLQLPFCFNDLRTHTHTCVQTSRRWLVSQSTEILETDTLPAGNGLISKPRRGEENTEAYNGRSSHRTCGLRLLRFDKCSGALAVAPSGRRGGGTPVRLGLVLAWTMC